MEDLVERADSESDCMFGGYTVNDETQDDRGGRHTMAAVGGEVNVCWHLHLSGLVSMSPCPRGTYSSNGGVT